MKSAYAVIMIAVCSVALCAQNPVPLVNNPLVPSSALPGGASFTLTVNGTGFVAASTVNWNGVPLQTTFVTCSQLTATVPASDIATPQTASVKVLNPAPGGGSSDVAWFTIRNPFSVSSFDEVEFPVGSGEASAPISADLNGDGFVDVLLLENRDSAVAVLLGSGNGSLGLPAEYTVGSASTGMSPGDFNGDGVMDVAVYDALGTVYVLLGNGDGTFLPARPSSSLPFGFGITTGDYNGDGKLDLAIAISFPTGQVAIMSGNGDGSFQGPVEFPVSDEALFVATGDFNGDGKLDLALTGSSQTRSIVSVVLGNGDGTFQSSVDYDTALNPQGVVVADLNGDGNLDLAVRATGSPGAVSVLLGNGDGTFQSHTDYSTMDTHSPSSSLAVSDLNGDGNLDIITPNFENTAVLIGTAQGTFTDLGFFPSPQFGAGVTVGDFDGNGLMDMVVTGDSEVAILPQITSVLSETLANFGSIRLGRSKTRQVTLMNLSNKVLRIDRIGVQGDDASVFSETNTCGSGVQPGASCKIAITFTPQLPRKYTVARVAVRDSATRLSQKIMLEGMGLK